MVIHETGQGIKTSRRDTQLGKKDQQKKHHIRSIINPLFVDQTIRCVYFLKMSGTF